MDKFLGTELFNDAVCKLLETVNFSTADFIYLWDVRNESLRFFGNIEREFDLHRQDSPTISISQLIEITHPGDRSAVQEAVRRITGGETDVLDVDHRLVKRDGSVAWVNSRGKLLRDDADKPTAVIGRVSEDALRHLFNPLTGLWNRTKLRSDLVHALNRGSGSLMMIDIIDLFSLSLSHSHRYGDSLLKEFAELLLNDPAVAQCYHVSRSMFAAVLADGRMEASTELYTRLKQATGKNCSLCAGVVPIDRELFFDENQLLDSAGFILNKAKQRKINCLEFFTAEEMHQRIKALNLLDELRCSVENGFEGFELVYQPQVRGGSYRLYGVEALLRFNSGSRRVFPDEFIPVLEQTRLIIPVGYWVLETALRQLRQWRRHIPDLCMSVNFSLIQFEDPYISDRIISCLKEFELPGSALTVEMTESLQLLHDEQLKNHLKYIQTYGVELAIDDFGTGYSNIGYLKHLDVEEIKIDRSFVSNVEKDSYNYKLIRNIIEFAKANSIRVCCEGMETSRELALLERLQPDMIQGYLFDKPMQPEDLERKYMDADSEEYAARCCFMEELYDFKLKTGVIHFNPRHILMENDVGLWIIRIDENGQRYEMHADETMERIMGLHVKCTPAECYEHWHSRIHPDHFDYVHKNVDIMVREGKMVQLKYPWIHPELGEVTVRCSGRRVQDSDGMVVLEGYHRILSDVEGY